MSKAWPVANLNPGAPLAENARRILRVRVGEFYSYEPFVSQPHAVKPLHDLRISAKRLRYTLELFRSVFGVDGETNISRVKSIQEELGNIHDVDVRIDLIKSELQKLSSEQIENLAQSLAVSPVSTHGSLVTSALRPPPDDPRRGLISLLATQYEERAEHYLAFKSYWDQFESENMRAELVDLSSANGETPVYFA
jgi:CHAD domain